MKIIFFGSDDFALKNLETLVASGHTITACVTQPDKPKGRGLRVQLPVIKAFAQKHKIPCLQPAKLDRVFIDELKAFNADLFVVIAYGRILPAEILSTPKIFSINVHASLLPKYRGAAPINWALINGDTETGITVIKMNEMMDAGETIAKEVLPILAADNAATLREKLAERSADLLVKTIHNLAHNNFTLTRQDLSAVTYAPKLNKELGAIRWDDKAVHIHNLVRGLIPWPNAFSYFQSKRFKILETEVVDDPAEGARAGEIFNISQEGIFVKTGQKSICLKKVQPDAGKPMDAKSFAIGHRIKVGNLVG